MRARRRLDGFRGRPAGDIEAVRETLLRVAYLADEVAQIAELDLNPVIALPPGAGAVAVDARVRVRRLAGAWSAWGRRPARRPADQRRALTRPTETSISRRDDHEHAIRSSWSGPASRS